MFVRDRYCQRRTCWSDDVAYERAGESKRMKNARHRGNPEWRGASVHRSLFHCDTLALILPCDANSVSLFSETDEERCACNWRDSYCRGACYHNLIDNFWRNSGVVDDRRIQNIRRLIIYCHRHHTSLASTFLGEVSDV